MSRLVRALGRVKAYVAECKQSMSPMPNPDWYEAQEPTRVNLKNIRKLPLSVHLKVWSSTFKSYGQSFEETFNWDRRRQEQTIKDNAAKSVEALKEIAKDVREATHNTPEDLEKSKKALRELLAEIHENRDGLKSAAQEKLDLIRFSLSEFSAGYREARDQELKRIMAMDKNVLQGFVEERWEEVKRASSILSDALLSDSDDDSRKASSAAKPSAATATTKAGDVATGAGGVGDKDQEAVLGSLSSPRDLMSQRARDALDDFLKDPDVEQLLGRARGFAKGRLVQAEAAARILKGEDEAVGAQSARGDRTDAEGAARSGPESSSDTPILSGLASDAREFVEERVAQARDGAREVADAVAEVRASHRSAPGEAGDDGVDGGDDSRKLKAEERTGGRGGEENANGKGGDGDVVEDRGNRRKSGDGEK